MRPHKRIFAGAAQHGRRDIFRLDGDHPQTLFTPVELVYNPNAHMVIRHVMELLRNYYSKGVQLLQSRFGEER